MKAFMILLYVHFETLLLLSTPGAIPTSRLTCVVTRASTGAEPESAIRLPAVDCDVSVGSFGRLLLWSRKYVHGLFVSKSF